MNLFFFVIQKEERIIVSNFNLRVIHKRRLLIGGHKCQNLLSKKTTKGEGGGHKVEKMGRRRLWIAPKLDILQLD